MNIRQDQSKKYNLFRAYDIRGVFPQDIDTQFFLELGQSVAYFVKKTEVKNRSAHFFVGFDIRTSSSMLAFALAAGMVSLGSQVTFSGKALPFGANLYSGRFQKSDVTAFVTASHLPPEWNGVKFYYSDGVGFSEEDNNQIRDIYLSKEYLNKLNAISWKELNSISMQEYYNEYKTYLTEKFSLKKKLKVVIDAGNGSTSLTAPEIFLSCGYDVKKLWCDYDPLFPNRSPEPNENSLQELARKVIDSNADFGVGFDADGDRGVIVDERGTIIIPEQIGIILGKFLLEMKDKNTTIKSAKHILANVECSLSIEKELENLATIERVKVGHTFLTLKAKETNAIMGMESSGHFVFPEYFLFDDAMLIPLITGKALEYYNEPLSKLLSKIGKLHKGKRTFDVDDNIKFKVIESLITTLKKDLNLKLNLIDGVGVKLDYGWVLIRASNTSPIIRLTVEGETEQQVQELLERFSKYLEKEITKFSS